MAVVQKGLNLDFRHENGVGELGVGLGKRGFKKVGKRISEEFCVPKREKVANLKLKDVRVSSG